MPGTVGSGLGGPGPGPGGPGLGGGPGDRACKSEMAGSLYSGISSFAYFCRRFGSLLCLFSSFT